jgi:hypothetical protein
MVNLKGFSRVTMAMDLVASLFIRSNVRIFVVENSSLGHAYRKCESYPIRVGGVLFCSDPKFVLQNLV